MPIGMESKKLFRRFELAEQLILTAEFQPFHSEHRVPTKGLDNHRLRPGIDVPAFSNCPSRHYCGTLTSFSQPVAEGDDVDDLLAGAQPAFVLVAFVDV